MDDVQLCKKLFSLIKSDKKEEFMSLLETVNIDDISFDINVHDNMGKYLINYAIIKNDIDIVEKLISKGARLDVSSNDGNTLLLMIPIYYEYNNMIEYLLTIDKKITGGSLVNFRDRNNKIPLHYAIEYNNVAAVKMLLEYNSNVNIVDKRLYNSLFYAVKSKSLDLCEIIIKNISDINSRCDTGETVLHLACSYQLYKIVELLLSHNANPNIIDIGHELTPLHYSIVLNNVKLVEILLNHGSDVNIQDIYGNTSIHHSIIENNYKIYSILIDHTKKNNISLSNVWNIEGETHLHTALKTGPNENTEKYINELIDKSNLNIQDNFLDTCLHHLCKLGLWKKYEKILMKKKLNIFVMNNKKELPIDYIKEEDKNQFINIIVDSYMFNLKHLKKTWTYDIDIMCSKDDEKIKEKCTQMIKKNIINTINELHKNKIIKCPMQSYPTIKHVQCVSVHEGEPIQICMFTGSTFDILFGLIYLLKKHKNICNIIKNIDKDTKIENFEIIWDKEKLHFQNDFEKKFKSCMNSNKYIILPFGIIMEQGNHAGYFIYDPAKKELERFETYGGSLTLHGVSYNSELLDNTIKEKFKEIDKNIKYISPSEYLPKIGFQLMDIVDKKHKKIKDPSGFCALWGIWYVDMRLTYSNINRQKLIDVLINNMKQQNISFKNIIRNYSINVTNIRDNVLQNVNLNVDDWLNEQYTEQQYNDVINEINLILSQKQ